MSVRFTALLFCFFTLIAASSKDVFALQYRVRDLGVLPGTTTTWANDINNAGEIVGWAGNYDSSRYPVIWDTNGNISQIAMLTGYSGHATAINDLGQVTISPDSSGCYIWNRTEGLKPIDLQGVTDINNLGQVAGAWGDAAVWNPDGTWTNIAGMDYAWAINDHGEVAGTAEGFYERAVKWVPGQGLVLLSPPDQYFTCAYGINNIGQVCGSAMEKRYDKSTPQYAAVWEPDGSLRQLGTLQSDYSMASANDINDDGYVVGWASDNGTSNDSPAVWNPNGDLFLLEILPGYDFGGATSINERGQIVGYCTSLSGHYSHAVIWEPVPEPSSLFALLCGIAGTAGIAWRRRG